MFSMKEEEFFEKYLSHVVKEDKAEEAKEAVAKLFAQINTKDGDLKQIVATEISGILSYIKPEFVADTKKTLDQWIKDKA